MYKVVDLLRVRVVTEGDVYKCRPMAVTSRTRWNIVSVMYIITDTRMMYRVVHHVRDRPLTIDDRTSNRTLLMSWLDGVRDPTRSPPTQAGAYSRPRRQVKII